MQIKVKGKIFYHVVLVGSNGETMLTSETYYSKSNANRAAKRLAQYFATPITK